MRSTTPACSAVSAWLCTNRVPDGVSALFSTFFGSGFVERKRGGSELITVSPSGRW